MSDFINTIELIGDDALTDGIISGTLTEFRDDRVRSIRPMAFADNKTLTVIECPNATKINAYAFQRATSLTMADFPNVTTLYENAFRDATALSEVNLPLLKTVEHYAFGRCSSLKKINFPSLTSTNDHLLWNCTSLVIADFSVLVDFGWHGALDGCKNLSALVLRRTSVVSLVNINNVSNSGISAGTGYIYVPRALVDQYKSATNWSTYADQFRALEDYTVDGTTTGELDETKI